MTGRTDDAQQVLERLASALGPDGLVTDARDTQHYLTDLTGLYRGAALAVARPHSVDQVSEIVRQCSKGGVALTARGGGTGFCGGAIPGTDRPHIVVSLERMRLIRSLDLVNDAIVAEAGCTLAEVRMAADGAGRLFPVSHGGEGSSQIGGMIATNAGGNNVVRYGMTRAHVLGLEVVLADGSVWNGLRLLRKDNAGYDLKQMFIGSEGTLGIVTAAALALAPRPISRATALIAVRDPKAALELFVDMRRQVGEFISAFELMPRSGIDLHRNLHAAFQEPFEQRHAWMVLVELETAIAGLELAKLIEEILGAALETGMAADAIIAQSEGQSARLWALREGIADAQASNRRVLKSDISVPLGEIAAFVDKAGVAIEGIAHGAISIPFGHVGDGNVHFNVLAPEDMADREFEELVPELSATIQRVAVELGGSISAEHGLGQSKRDSAEAAKTPEEIFAMRQIKSALDPGDLFNPGKLIGAKEWASR